jgi:phosphatidylcholine synthase
MTLAETVDLRANRPSRRRARLLRRCLAWCVHFYTALGLVMAAGIAVLIVRGDPLSLAWVFVLMLAATLIDSTDGVLARAVRVKEVVPGFDGRRLDDLVDFLTFTFLPLLLLWRAEVLPRDMAWCWLVPLLASAYGFCQVQAKTADGYFLGFPSLWNVVAFYLYVLHLPHWLTLSIVWLLALLTFVPSRYLYPSLGRNRLNRITNLLGMVWAGLMVWILVRLLTVDDGEALADGLTLRLTVLSLTYPVYYLVASWLVSVQHWRAQRRTRGVVRNLGHEVPDGHPSTRG